MRRTAYNERLDRSSYLRVGKSRNSDPQANSFRIESSRLPEDNYVGPRTPHGYYQSRGVRPLLHRPLTMQKTNPIFEHKRKKWVMQGREASTLRGRNTRGICMLVRRGSIRKAIILRTITRRAGYSEAVHGGPMRKWLSPSARRIPRGTQATNEKQART